MATNTAKKPAKALERPTGEGPTANPKPNTTVITIAPLRYETLELELRGISPLVINRFSQKAITEMMETQKAGSTSRGKKKRDPKDFDLCFEQAKHVSEQGWEGIHAAAFRNAAISACRTCGVVMTRAKLALWVLADGFDRVDGVPLVKLTGEPAQKHVAVVRNRTGVADVRCRPMYRSWGCKLRLQFDRDMLTASDVANLITRVGYQVGVAEGRPDSKDSAGCGWGLFEVV